VLGGRAGRLHLGDRIRNSPDLRPMLRDEGTFSSDRACPEGDTAGNAMTFRHCSHVGGGALAMARCLSQEHSAGES
jgi:hypothetical protein